MVQIQKNISLQKYNTWVVGGPAEFFCLPYSVDEVVQAQAWAREKKIPVHVLGGGSNVLISDHGVSGLTICLKQMNQLKFETLPAENKDHQQTLSVKAQAGVSKFELLKIFLKHELDPALFLAGIPGDVGGGVVMNAGIGERYHPKEFGQIVFSVDVIKPDGSLQKYKHQEIKWDYRHSTGWQPGIISEVEIRWPMVKNPSILVQVKAANQMRLQKQPLDLPSCGSVFVNPGPKAAALIDSCGLKGYTLGGAQVSKKHANFIVNFNQAKASEIKQVIEDVQKIVFEKTKIQLQTEVVMMGEF